jgi:hypothetical protein
MKNIWICLLFISIQFATNAQTFGDALQYNDYIVSQQNLIGEKLIAFNNQFSIENVTKEVVQQYYNELLDTTRVVVARMHNLEAFQGDNQLLKAATALMEFYQQTVEGAYMQIINIYFDPGFNDQSIETLQNLLNKVTADESVLDSQFQESQSAFAEKYGFTLSENELQEQLDSH